MLRYAAFIVPYHRQSFTANSLIVSATYQLKRKPVLNTFHSHSFSNWIKRDSV